MKDLIADYILISLKTENRGKKHNQMQFDYCLMTSKHQNDIHTH